MKISKVGHTRTAVGVTENKGPEGLLYIDPSKKAVIDPIERVKDRIRKANNLYSVFGPVNDENDKNRKNEVADTFNGIIKKYTSRNRDKGINSERDKTIYKLDADRLIDDVTYGFKGFVYDDETKKSIDEALNVLLKGTLRREDTKKAFENLFEACIPSSEGSHKEKVEADKDSIKSYIVEPIVKDYSKSKMQKNTIESLKKQNLVVQPVSRGGNTTILAPASSNNRRSSKNSVRLTKAEEKEALTSFLEMFATLSEEDRKDSLMRLRRLADLYFYGKDGVIADTFDVWVRHNEAKQNTAKIVDYTRPDYSVYKIQDDDPEDEVKRKKKEKKIVQKAESGKLRDMLRTRNMELFRTSFKAIDEDSNNLFFEDKNVSKFFIHHIEGEFERIFSNGRSDDFRLETGYISEKVWKGLINYLSIKYIAIGKSVYNFAMDELTKPDGDMSFGRINDAYIKGITSFEYEKISAEETLQRETAVYVSFASNHLSRAVVKADSDIDLMDLKISENQDKLVDKNLITKSILQFFGGKSSWEKFSTDLSAEGFDSYAFLNDIKTLIYQLRNESFHFKTEKKNTDISNPDLISDMFEYECRKACVLEKQKFYSNNLPLYYKDADLNRVLEKLYSTYTDRKSQVPSFERVMKRGDFSEYLRQQGIKPALDDKNLKKFESAVYYLYKQVYYNDFLAHEKDAKNVFIKNIRDMKIHTEIGRNGKSRTVVEDKPIEDFRNRVLELEHYSLSEICQMIMTEYNQQNNQNIKKSQRNVEIFKHYQLGLYKALNEALTIYVKNNNALYGFIKEPHIDPDAELESVEQFLPDYTSAQYEELIKKVSASHELKKWYIMTRFLNPKQTNQLVGALRSYVQYVDSIKRRASETGNALPKFEEAKPINDIIQVIDMCTRICGNTSNNLEDYFEDNEDYADYLEQFLDFEMDESRSDNKAAMLGAFCEDKIEGQRIEIYHDGTNPILNRNIVLAKLYGATGVVSRAIPRVDSNIIKEYYSADKDIESYRKDGGCKTADQQKRLKEYQELKNRVEFRDVVDYSEIINELYGQLINWTYLRERDLMYFQLGFHYMCLNNNSEKPDAYKKIELVDKTDNSRCINGAILYQIVAMYTYGVDLYYRGHKAYPDDKKSRDYTDKKNKWEAFTGQIGQRVPMFALYSGYMNKGNSDVYRPTYDLYTSGLELFEVIDEHDDIIKLRNYIDHFNYYAKRDRSLLGIYSEIFDRFFTYDMKYQKNVPNILSNILAGHLLVPSFVFETGSKMVGKTTKACAKIDLKNKNGLKPDSFTYKLDDDDRKKVKGPSKLMGYVENVIRILYYSEGGETPEIELSEGYYKFSGESSVAKDKTSSKNNNGRKMSSGNGRKPSNNKGGNSSSYRNNNSSGGLTSTPFDAFF
ncbi:hypothetical protein SAMN02910369_02235 [Lachnospiraceae bacterium NE2001]|nr:hypothetical protein SAMN02910369_02235 [Lachnospiraceae bacterium NE2001]